MNFNFMKSEEGTKIISYILGIVIVLSIIFKEYVKQNIISISGIVFGLVFIGAVAYVIKKIKISKDKKLILIILVVIIVKLMFPLYHTWSPDDMWIMEEGKNFVLKGEAVNCVYDLAGVETCQAYKTIGYPVVNGLSFLMFGLNNYISLILTTIFSIITVLMLYLAIKKIDKEKAFWASLLIGVSLQFTITGAHVDSIAFATALIATALYFFIEYLYEQKNESQLPAIIFLLLATMARIEYGLTAILLVPIYINRLSKNKVKNLVLIIMAVAIFAILFLYQQGQMGALHSHTEYFNTYISLDNISHNFNSIKYHYGSEKVIGFILLVIVGFFLGIKNKKKDWIFLSMAALPLLFYLMFESPHLKETIFFIAILLMPLIAEVILEVSKSKHKKIIGFAIAIIIIVAGINATIDARARYDENPYFYLDTVSLNKLTNNLTKDCYLITERISFASATNDLKVIGLTNVVFYEAEFLKLIEDNCAVLYENQYCYQNIEKSMGRTDAMVDSTGRCKYVKENYNLEKMHLAERKDIEYNLYKITPK